MRTDFISADKACQILFGSQWFEKEFDPETAQFASGADVCDWLSSAFGFKNEDYRQLHAAQFPPHVSVAEWKKREDGSGYLDLVRMKTVGEVYAELREIIGEYPDGGEEYFSLSAALGSDHPWPKGEIRCFSANGSSEGDYTHVEVHNGYGEMTLIFLGKTFMGRDASWAFARRLADLLEVQ